VPVGFDDDDEEGLEFDGLTLLDLAEDPVAVIRETVMIPGTRLLDVVGKPRSVWIHYETTIEATSCSVCGHPAMMDGRLTKEGPSRLMTTRKCFYVWHVRRWRCPEPGCVVSTWTEDDPLMGPGDVSAPEG
jgi:hypothetical protein